MNMIHVWVKFSNAVRNSASIPLHVRLLKSNIFELKLNTSHTMNSVQSVNTSSQPWSVHSVETVEIKVLFCIFIKYGECKTFPFVKNMVWTFTDRVLNYLPTH